MRCYMTYEKHVIKDVLETKFRGLILDSNLTWKHIKFAAKINQGKTLPS